MSVVERQYMSRPASPSKPRKRKATDAPPRPAYCGWVRFGPTDWRCVCVADEESQVNAYLAETYGMKYQKAGENHALQGTRRETVVLPYGQEPIGKGRAV